MQQLGKSTSTSGAVGHILKLFSGSAIGQLISIFFVPVLTILYTPKEYTAYAAYSAIIGVSAVFYSLRLEQLLVTTPGNKVYLLTQVSKWLGTRSCAFVAVISYFYFGHLYGQAIGCLFAGLTGLGTYASGHINIEYQLAMREEKTQSMATSRIITPSISGALQGLFFFLHSGMALILGDVLGRLASLLVIQQVKFFKRDRESIRMSHVKLVLQENFEFVKYNLMTSLSSVISVQLPFFLLPLLYKSDAGSFLFALRLVSLPIPLISQSISLVLLKESSTKSSNEMSDNVKKIVKVLFVFLVPSMLWVSLYSESISNILLPSQWKSIGFYLSYFAIWIIFWVPSSALSSVLIYKNKQRASFKFSLFELTTRSTAVLVPYLLGVSLSGLAIFVTLGNCLIALSALYWFLKLQNINLYVIYLETLPIMLSSVIPIALYFLLCNILHTPSNALVSAVSLMCSVAITVRLVKRGI